MPVNTLYRTSIISSSIVLLLNPFANLSLAPLSLLSIYGPDLGVWPNCWVSSEFLRAPIPRKGSGSTTTTQHHFVHVDSLSYGRGVEAYIPHKLKFEICKHQLFKSKTLWLNIHECKRVYTIGIVYHHPPKTNIPYFLDDPEICISNLTTSNSLFYIMGDLNINIYTNNR